MDPRGGFNDISQNGVFSPSAPLTHTHIYSVRAKHMWSSLLLWTKLFSWATDSVIEWVCMHITHAHATLRYIASPAVQLVAVVNPAAPSKCTLINTSHSLLQESACPPVCCEEGPAGSTVVAILGPINVVQQMIHNVQCRMFLIKSHVTCSQSPKEI